MPFRGSPTALVCHGDTFGGVLQMRGRIALTLEWQKTLS
jgi:hypothetical protein